MKKLDFTFFGHEFQALASGALWWPLPRVLVVSDLHFGKSERIARRGGVLLPPYETRETLTRLDHDITNCDPQTVICLGDSFDDLTAARHVIDKEVAWLSTLMAGRKWVWIEGNHDPGPIDFGGTHRHDICIDGVEFRHIADADKNGEISGHYHPKARLSIKGVALTRPCFLLDGSRLILPAYGTYTGGLYCDTPPLSDLMRSDARAILTGKNLYEVPVSKLRR